jgi:hypothetical protein
MSISFTCPHCAAFTEVDDMYAGHSGPCATCGRRITIPYLPSAAPVGVGTLAKVKAAAKAPAKHRSAALLLLLLVSGGALAVVLLLALGMALLRPAVQMARSASWQSECGGNLERIGLALQQYHDHHGTFPPAYLADAQGKPMHSWRVLILPYLGDQAKTVYQQYDFNQPWDSDTNMRLASYMPEVYGCPEHPDALASQETTYMVVMGAETAFPNQSCTSLTEITDPLDQTILVVETSQSGVHWLKPQDLAASKMAYEINGRESTDAGSHHARGGAHVLTADGQALFLNTDFSPDYLQSMMTINGGEILPQNFLRSY